MGEKAEVDFAGGGVAAVMARRREGMVLARAGRGGWERGGRVTGKPGGQVLVDRCGVRWQSVSSCE
jgi:hypothetical protein